MSEELENKVTETTEPVENATSDLAENTAPVTEPAAEQPIPVSEEAGQLPQEEPAEPVYADAYEQPQIIVQKERGFSHYVGFALISVLCICFYFMPGIAVTFLVSLIPGVALGAIAAWAFSAILSIVAWAIFKIKISGFKRSFLAYIGLCIVVLAILIAIEVLTEANVFSKIIALLCGGDAT
ncbi:MAG: hypothetical protein II892_07415 [Fibrobacter sp.]|nr:hypothetical protein [Fibrobacter sp.]